MQPQSDSGLTENFIIPIPSLTQSSSPGIVYVSFTRDAPEEYAVASFQCVLKFISKEVDPASGEPEEEGYEDEYQLEEVELAPGGDYIIPSYASFAAEWDVDILEDVAADAEGEGRRGSGRREEGKNMI